MKKIICLSLLLCLILLSFAAIGCTEEPEVPQTPENEHTHVASVGYRYDEQHHWTPCTAAGCNIKLNWAEHVFDGSAVTTFPTEEQEGVMTYSCMCGQTKTEPITFDGVDDAIFSSAVMDERLSHVSVRVTATQQTGEESLVTNLNFCFDGDLMSMSGTLRGEEISKMTRDSGEIMRCRGLLFFFKGIIASDLSYDPEAKNYSVGRDISVYDDMGGLWVFSNVRLRLLGNVISAVTADFEAADGSVGELKLSLYDYGNIVLQ